MESLSCHSIETTWAMTIKNIIYVDANVMNMYACMQNFSFIPLTDSEEKIFEYFFKNLPFMLPWQPIKFSDFDKIHTNRRGLLKKHFSKKKNQNICSETAKIANFHFSHYKSMEIVSCHSNQSSYPIVTTSSPKGNDRSPESNVPRSICPKTLCSLSPIPMMLHIKFDQDWLTGFRDI